MSMDYEQELLSKIESLQATVDRMAQTIAEQAETIKALNATIARLLEQKNKNFNNSSKPPSSDGHEGNGSLSGRRICSYAVRQSFAKSCSCAEYYRRSQYKQSASDIAKNLDSLDATATIIVILTPNQNLQFALALVSGLYGIQKIQL